MPERDQEPDADMQEAVEWDAGHDMDEEFRAAECVEVELDSDGDAPVDSDGEEGASDDQHGDIGILDENQVYDDEDLQPHVDDALTSVAHKESVLSVAICPVDRNAVVTGGQDDIAVLWQLEERSGAVKFVQRYRLEGHTDSVVQVAFSHDGIYVATGSYDGTVRIWASASGSLLHSLEGPSKEIEWILWHPKGHAILAGSADTMAWMWWAPTGKLMQIFAGHAQSVTCGCWGMGGKVICTGSEDRGVIVWNPRAGAPQQHMRQVHQGGIISICAHPEAPIVVTGSEDSIAKVIQIETGKEIASLTGHMDSVESVGFSGPIAGGMMLLATGSMDGKVLVWDGKTFDLRCTLKEHFEHGGIVRFKWLPGTQHPAWLCTCATDNTLRLFNALSGECLRTLRGHGDTVLDLDLALGDAASEAARELRVVSGSDDRTCRVFSVALWTAGEAHAAPAAGAQAAAASAAEASRAQALSPGATGARDGTDTSPASLPV